MKANGLEQVKSENRRPENLTLRHFLFSEELLGSDYPRGSRWTVETLTGDTGLVLLSYGWHRLSFPQR